MKPVVLVHGANAGGWMWERVTPLLDAASVPWVAPDLPSVALATPGVGHIEDMAAVEALLDVLPGDEPAVLVGHSRGGIVISNAGSHPRVGQLVFVTAMLLDAGEASMASEAIVAARHVDANGTTTFDPERAPAVIMNDCSPADIAWAMPRLDAQFVGPVPEGRYAWRSKPSTYVVCTLDRAILPESQRLMAQRATSVVEWETGHCPMVNRPDLVASLLVGLAS